MNPIIAHGIIGSPFLRAVLLTCIEKGAPYRIVPLMPGQHRMADYTALHPFSRIPAVEHGDFKLYETQAITRYIDQVFDGPSLVPADPQRAARMNQIMGICDWYLFPKVGSGIGFNRVVAPKFGMPVNEEAVAAAVPDAKLCFGVLDRLVGDQAYLTGDSLSLADLHLIPQMDMLSAAPECAEILAGTTRLLGWIERMRERPSVATTTWDALAAAA